MSRCLILFFGAIFGNVVPDGVLAKVNVTKDRLIWPDPVCLQPLGSLDFGEDCYPRMGVLELHYGGPDNVKGALAGCRRQDIYFFINRDILPDP